jgi:large subunit ribosomal protein L10
MALTKTKKVELIGKLEKIVGDTPNLVFVKFKGLSVLDTSLMRSALRSAGVGYMVVKKTLLKRVLDAAKFEGDLPSLDGEVAIVYGTDPIAPAREVAQFTKKYNEMLSMLGGVFERKYMNKAEIIAVASIPSLHVLYGQFANVINSPIQGLVVALDQIANKKTN